MTNCIKIFCLFLLIISCSKQKESQKTNLMDTVAVSKSSTTSLHYFLPKSTTGEIVVHKFYTLSYREKDEQAEWVAYELKKSELSRTNFKRPYFIEDPLVETGSANWKNYIHSGYDRGHLCPAGDRRFSREAFNETFYTSNITPQKNDFNAGIWNRLEQKIRYWAAKYDGLYVVTGGVLTGNLSHIGREDVSVPKYFYKILLDDTDGHYKTIAFLVPHEDSERPLYEFVVPIDQIEKMTGLDFFPNLPDTQENILEKSSSYKDWSF